MPATRRHLLRNAFTLALTSTISLVPVLNPLLAQTVPSAELMMPGPLGEQAMGADDAPVTIIEYASMTCPHCAHFTLTTFPLLKEKYIDSGKVRFILRELPFDPIAAGAFMVARCAPKGGYFGAIDLLFKTQREWMVEQPIAPLMAVAKQVGLSEESFNACLANKELLDGIQWVRNRARTVLNVRATPTFFINGQIARGALQIDDMAKIIDPLLKGS